MTGAGIQNFSRNPMRCLKKLPNKSTSTATASVWYIFKCISIVVLLSYVILY